MLTNPLLNDIEIIIHFAVVGLQLILKSCEVSFQNCCNQRLHFITHHWHVWSTTQIFLCEHIHPPDVYRHKSFHSITWSCFLSGSGLDWSSRRKQCCSQNSKLWVRPAWISQALLCSHSLSGSRMKERKLLQLWQAVFSLPTCPSRCGWLWVQPLTWPVFPVLAFRGCAVLEN